MTHNKQPEEMGEQPVPEAVRKSMKEMKEYSPVMQDFQDLSAMRTYFLSEHRVVLEKAEKEENIEWVKLLPIVLILRYWKKLQY